MFVVVVFVVVVDNNVVDLRSVLTSYSRLRHGNSICHYSIDAFFEHTAALSMVDPPTTRSLFLAFLDCDATLSMYRVHQGLVVGAKHRAH